MEFTQQEIDNVINALANGGESVSNAVKNLADIAHTSKTLTGIINWYLENSCTHTLAAAMILVGYHTAKKQQEKEKKEKVN